MHIWNMIRSQCPSTPLRSACDCPQNWACVFLEFHHEQQSSLWSFEKAGPKLSFSPASELCKAWFGGQR